MTRGTQTVGVAIAVVMAVLVVTAIPVQAAGADDVASEHTTDSDFNNAATLDTIHVDGTGTAAHAELPREVISDFEDGSATTTSPNWDGWDSTKVSVQSTTVLNGTQTGKNHIDAGGRETILTNRDSATSQDAMAVLQADARTGDQGDSMKFATRNGTNYLVEVYFKGNGNVEAEGTTVRSWSIDTPYRVRVAYDFPNNQYTLFINGVNEGTFSFANSNTASSWDEVRILNDGDTGGGTAVNVFLDNVRLLSGTDSGTYVSQNHTVEEIEGAFTNLSLSNAEATVKWQHWDGSKWVTQKSSTYTTSGNKTVSWPKQNTGTWRVNVTFERTATRNYQAELADEGVLFEASAPDVKNGTASPTGGQTQSTSTVDLSIDVNDTDFATSQSDTLTLEWFVDGTKKTTTTETANGTATTSVTINSPGSHDWHVQVSDDYGTVVTSETFTDAFSTPGTFHVRNENAPNNLVTTSLDLTVYDQDGNVQSNSTTDGTVDMSGWPTDEELLVEVDDPNNDFATRTFVAETTTQNQTVYLLNTSAVSSVDVRFQLDDKTGLFGENSEFIVQRSLTRSGTSKYRTVYSNEFGVKGSVATLEPDQRYRITVRNDDGDVRHIGSYDAPSSETVTIEVKEQTIELANEQTAFAYNATKNENPKELVFTYNDPDGLTEDFQVAIYERGNPSNEIHNSTTNGPFSNLTISPALTNAQYNTTWVVEFAGTRDGQDVSGQLIVGQAYQTGIDMNKFWLQVGSVGLVLVLPSLTPGRPGVGASLAVGAAGVFWLINVLPAEIGGGVLLAGGFLAFAHKLRSRRGVVQ